jgi:hypothetical protein
LQVPAQIVEAGLVDAAGDHLAQFAFRGRRRGEGRLPMPERAVPSVTGFSVTVAT